MFFRTTKALTPTNKQLEERKEKKLQTAQAAKAAQAAQSALAAAQVAQTAQAAQVARKEQAVKNVQTERAAAVRLKRMETNHPQPPPAVCLVVKLRPLDRAVGCLAVGARAGWPSCYMLQLL